MPAVLLLADRGVKELHAESNGPHGEANENDDADEDVHLDSPWM